MKAISEESEAAGAWQQREASTILGWKARGGEQGTVAGGHSPGWKNEAPADPWPNKPPPARSPCGCLPRTESAGSQ